MNRFSRPLILAAALCFAILLDLAVSTSVAHASNRRLVYQGRVLRPDGLPLEGVFRVQVKIYSPDPKRCLLWGEEKDVAFDKGAFSLEAGDPLKRLSGADAGGATNFTNAFLNESALALTGLTCSDGDTYTPGSTDDRVMVVTLHDGGNVVRTFDGPIKAVPFALHATNSEMIGGYSAPFLMKVNPVAAHEPSRSFSTLGFSILYDLAESNSVDFGGKLLQGLTEPIQPQDAATKNYVDQVLSTSLGTLNVVKLVDAISASTGLIAVTGGPITSEGTFSFGFLDQTSGVLAAPTGGAGQPLFRLLEDADISAVDATKITGTLQVAQGGLGYGSFTGGVIPVFNVLSNRFEGMACNPGDVLVWMAPIGWTCEPKTTGAVTSVDLLMPLDLFNVTGGPVTNAGSFDVQLNTQPVGFVFAAPTGPTGDSGVPTFRALASSDLPGLDASKIVSGTFDVARVPDLDASKIVSGILGVDRGGTGLDGSVATTGQLLIGDGAGGFALGNLVGSSGVLIDNYGGSIGISLDPLASGAVTHVGFEAPTGLFSVIGSPLTGAGTISLNLGTQGIAQVFAAPTGAVGVPEFRSLVASDITAGIFDVLRIPDLDASKIVSGTLGVERGGTGLDGSVATTGQLLIGDGTGGFALGNLVGSSGVLIDNYGGSIGISLDPLASGAVTHVGFDAPTSVFSVSGAPLTGAGTISLSFGTQNTAQVFAAPTGAAGVPEFRSLIASDITAGIFDVLRIPDLDAAKIVSGTLGVERGGTGLDGSVATTGQLLIGDGTGGFALGNLVGSSGVLIDNYGGSIGISLDPLASGAVTHVGFEAPTGLFSVIGSPLTGAGTISLNLGTQGLAHVFAAPTGASGLPEFRSLIASDITAGIFDVLRIPDLDAAKIVSGTLGVERGGTGLDGSVATSGQLLIGDGAGGFALGNLIGSSGVLIDNHG
ncbi:MAG: hypothetical protein KF767_16375, partial [Bdellovibrionaceae bacterium]|nr:hypothetical protein [Pseudobdellovibrionaceae bacterium]